MREYSASTHCCLPFFIYMKSFLPLSMDIGAGHMSCLANECEQKLWTCLHNLTWPLRLLHSYPLPKEEFGSGATVLSTWVPEWKNHGTFLKMTTARSRAAAVAQSTYIYYINALLLQIPLAKLPKEPRNDSGLDLRWGVGEGESARASPDSNWLYLQNQVRVFQTSHSQEILEMFSNEYNPECYINFRVYDIIKTHTTIIVPNKGL